MIRVGHLVIDCQDLDAQQRFWTRLLGIAVTQTEDDWRDLSALGEGGPVLSLQQVPERKRGKNRLHLDLEITDFDAAVTRADELGATPAGGVHGEGTSRWQVWHDPEGNEFCLCSVSG